MLRLPLCVINTRGRADALLVILFRPIGLAEALLALLVDVLGLQSVVCIRTVVETRASNWLHHEKAVLDGCTWGYPHSRLVLVLDSALLVAAIHRV